MGPGSTPLTDTHEQDELLRRSRVNLGSCLCGKIQIEITSSPLATLACHCRGCQKLTSSAFSLCALIPIEGFEATGVEPVVGALHGDTKHLYCPHCKIWLYSLPAGVNSYVNVHPTLLDDRQWCSPFVEVHTAESLPWAKTGAKYSFANFPDDSSFEMLVMEFQASSS